MAIGSKIQELLTEQNRNVRWLERETGISHNTLYSIIRRDNASVDGKLLSLIADALGTTPEYLTGTCDTKENITQTQIHCIQQLLSKSDYILFLDDNENAQIHNKSNDTAILVEKNFIGDLYRTLEDVCITALSNLQNKT